MELGVLSREQEERKHSRKGDGLVLDPAKRHERDNAIKELENEKKQMYDELKSSLGESEADVQIKLFMKGRYKQRMTEIDKQFSKAETKETPEQRQARKAKAR